MPLTKKVSLGFNADYGYLGSITGEPVSFERFVVGGSPFETSGFNSFFGKDVIFMRGYPIAVIGPKFAGDPVGGRILNRYMTRPTHGMVLAPTIRRACTGQPDSVSGCSFRFWVWSS
jgi:outer membrane protein insertion porin family